MYQEQAQESLELTKKIIFDQNMSEIKQQNINPRNQFLKTEV